MPKIKIVHVCQECGHQTGKWQGKCPSCSKWNTLIEETARAAPSSPSRQRIGGAPSASFSTPKPTSTNGIAGAIPIPRISAESGKRKTTGIPDLDRVLGGGLVPGEVILISGEPGIGKSTLLLQTAKCLCESIEEKESPVLYITAEESASQIRLRGERLHALLPSLWVLAENDLDTILNTVQKSTPQAVILDSIQMIYWADLGSAPGSVGQVRECAAALTAQAKRMGHPLFLVGHVTKDGSFAGPKTLEHLVDAVLNFEGDRFYTARILRASKNRFGAVNEMAVFEMAQEGLRPVGDPSRLFLEGRRAGLAGTVVTSLWSGSRPALAEVQALVAPAPPGMAKRRVSGMDINRISMILAVLERHCGYLLADRDVFVNAADGAEAKEPGADLAIAIAIAGSVKDKPLAEDMVVVGEVGLGGELRPTNQLTARLKEAERLGFTHALVPKGSVYEGKMKLWTASTLDEALGKV